MFLLLFHSLGVAVNNPRKKNLTQPQIIVSRERVVSLDSQTRTTGPEITALLRSLAHFNAYWIAFSQERKKHEYFYFSSSTKWRQTYLNPRDCRIPGKGSVS